MATMLFDRIVPSGNNAYFPFQMSAASLSPTATVYEANDAAGADTALASGVSVDDMGGGLYALKVLAANMTADKLYYGVVTSGTESVRIPMWAFAPTKHIADVLADLAVVDGVVDDIKTEIGDVSAQSFTGISAPATVAAGLAEIFNKVNGVQSDLDNATDGLGALKTLIETETSAIDSALTTIDNEIAALQGDVTSILADTNELQGDWANGGRLDLLLDRTVAASEAAEDLIGLAADTSSAATVFGKIAALSGDLATVDSNVDAIKAAVEDATYGLSALETRLDSVDTDLGNIEGKIDTVDTVVDGIASALADGTSGLAALKSEIDANEAKIDILDTNVDTIQAAVENATYGLSAIEAKVMTVDTVVDGIASALADGTTGLAALKSEIDANEAKLDIIDTVVDGLATEVGDVSAAFGGGSPPATVAAALKVIYDAQQSAANVWDDAITGSESAGTAGKRLYDLSEDWANGGRLDVILDELTTQGDTNEGKLDDVLADTVDLQSKLGAPTGASLSADIAAIKSVVDTLQVTTNARLAPSMPSELYSAKEAIRVALGLNVYEGTSGALEDPNPLGTNGNAQGQALIKAKTVGGGSDPSLFDAASAGNALGTTDASGLTSWYKMVRAGTGKFVAYAEIPAYFNKTVEVSFYAEDSDPNAVQKFETSRYMLVRSPVQASFGGGAF
jgi:peptidoglycan hydrolase CwlO-like protein